MLADRVKETLLDILGVVVGLPLALPFCLTVFSPLLLAI